MTCYGLVRGGNWQQEWYETASRDAGRRTRQLKKLGFTAYASGQGEQITNVGRCRMTLVTIRFDGRILADSDNLPPAPERIVQL